MAARILTLDGNAFDDIASFFDEINRVFMAGETWALGHSLDALDDMLYGAYGAIQGNEPVVLHWKNMERSKTSLGLGATRAFYQAKLAQPEKFDARRARKQLDDLEQGTGPTYFDIVLQIIADHPNIELRSTSN